MGVDGLAIDIYLVELCMYRSRRKSPTYSRGPLLPGRIAHPARPIHRHPTIDLVAHPPRRSTASTTSATMGSPTSPQCGHSTSKSETTAQIIATEQSSIRPANHSDRAVHQFGIWTDALSQRAPAFWRAQWFTVGDLLILVGRIRWSCRGCDAMRLDTCKNAPCTPTSSVFIWLEVRHHLRMDRVSTFRGY